MVRRKLIRSRVQSLLKQSRIDNPPVPIRRIALSLGAKVCHQAATDSLSGFLLRDDAGEEIVIGVNNRHHRHRQRFSLAHEVGHLILHRGEPVHVDRIDSIFRIDRRDEQSSKGTDDREKEANLFAAEILMPKHFIEKDLRQLNVVDEDAIKLLARKYDVSVQALTFRMVYLGYFPSVGDTGSR
jgi:Zn-dependent peptidase ImmA (M78 family)